MTFGNIFYDVEQTKAHIMAMRPDIGPVNEAVIIAHEIGHAMGNFHRSEQGLDPVWPYERQENDAIRIENYIRCPSCSKRAP